MNCQELTDQIEEYKPYNEQEEKDKRLILDWIRNNENAFSRENTVAHMTAPDPFLNTWENALNSPCISDKKCSVPFGRYKIDCRLIISVDAFPIVGYSSASCS